MVSTAGSCSSGTRRSAPTSGHHCPRDICWVSRTATRSSSQWYTDQAVDLRLNTLVTTLDRDRHTVTVSGGETIGYDKLLLATGASPRRLPVLGDDLEGVLYLRRVGDCERILQTFHTASRIVFVGGGWIGLEVAAAARDAGVEVTVLEAGELPLLRVLGRHVAPLFADLHREHGVDLRLTAQVAEIVGQDGAVVGVRLTDGTRIEADAVVVGIGAVPHTQLADESGLHIDNGITVDASLRTSDPDIWAAGDVANAFHPMLGKHIRVEHWANALHQPDTAARSMLGQTATYDRVPCSSPTSTTWAWSTPATPSPAGTTTSSSAAT